MYVCMVLVICEYEKKNKILSNEMQQKITKKKKIVEIIVVRTL